MGSRCRNDEMPLLLETIGRKDEDQDAYRKMTVIKVHNIISFWLNGNQVILIHKLNKWMFFKW